MFSTGPWQLIRFGRQSGFSEPLLLEGAPARQYGPQFQVTALQKSKVPGRHASPQLHRVKDPTSLGALSLGQPRAGTRTVFEHGEHIRQFEEILDRFVVVDQDNLATGLMRRDVEANDRTQSGAVHSCDLLEIEDDSSAGWKQIPHVGV